MSVKESITTERIAKYTELVEPKKKLRKKGSRGVLIFFLVCVIIGACIGFLGPFLMEKGILKLELKPPFPIKEPFGFLYVILAFVWFYITLVLHTVIHEGGHLVFGLLSGYRFLSFRVFSFTIVKKDGKLVRKKLKTPGMAGQCLLTPPDWEEDKPYPHVWYNMGGGLMNLIFCLLTVPFFFTGSPLLHWVFGIFSFTGVLLGLANLIPLTMGLPNDGKNFLLCQKDRENQRAFYLQLKINSLLSDGTMISEIPEEMLTLTPGKLLNPLTCFVRLLAFYKCLDAKEEEKAEACLKEMEQWIGKLPTGFVNTIDLERLYLLLLTEGSIEEIAACYAVLQPVFIQVKDISVLRVKYACYSLLNEEQREMVEWLVYSKNGKLIKKLPKQKKKVTAEQIYEDMEKAYERYPVIGEAELHMSLARNCRDLAKAREEVGEDTAE